GAVLDAVNVIPDAAVIGVDRRLLPGENPDEAVAAIRAVLDELVVAPFHAGVALLRTWPPYAIRDDEPIALAARDAVRQSGRPGRFGMDPAANDSSLLDRAGIPAVVLGPGAAGAAHTTHESLPIADV